MSRNALCFFEPCEVLRVILDFENCSEIVCFTVQLSLSKMYFLFTGFEVNIFHLN